MEFITNCDCTMLATRSRLASVHSDPECVLQRPTVDVGAKSTPFEFALLKPAVTTSMETALSSMGRVMALHTVPKANEDQPGNIVGSDSNATDYKLQPLSKYVIKLSLDKRGEIDIALADLSLA